MTGTRKGVGRGRKREKQRVGERTVEGRDTVWEGS